MKKIVGMGLPIVLLILYLFIGWIVADQSLIAKQKDLTTSPSEFGIPFDDVTFHPSNDQDINLKGWWMENQSSRATIIWVHGLDSTRDSNMDLISDIYEDGYSLFAFDLRGHGESEKVPMGAGVYEHRDMLGAIGLVKTRAPEDPIILFGVSFGGALAIIAGDEDPMIKGVISDSSFASIPELIEEEVAARTSMPAWGAGLLKPGIIFAAKWFKGADISKVAPAEEVSKIRFPIALIHCKDSERVPFSHAERILELAPEDTVTLFISGCDHAKGYEETTSEYVKFVLDYMDNRLLN